MAIKAWRLLASTINYKSEGSQLEAFLAATDSAIVDYGNPR